MRRRIAKLTPLPPSLPFPLPQVAGHKNHLQTLTLNYYGGIVSGQGREGGREGVGEVSHGRNNIKT